MTTIDFPTNPTTGQKYTYNNIVYTFTGTTWTASANISQFSDPILTGAPTATTPPTPDNSQRIATTAFANALVAAKAVRYDAAQSLTAPQQAQARSNIAAAPATAFDTSWQPFAYMSGWVDYGAPFSPCGYRLLPNGLVILKGLVTNGTASAVLTLPVGYRPGIQLLLYAATANTAGGTRIDITTAGLLTHSTASDAWLSLNGISFLAEN